MIVYERMMNNMSEKYFQINVDKISIKCKIYYENLRNIKNVVLSVHGFGGNKDNNASKKLAEDLENKYEDIAVITFDWPCHGKDVRQKLSLEDCDNYLSIMLDYIKKEMGVDNIFLQGTSFGGYLVLKYITEHNNPFKKIVLRSPAINMAEVLTKKILTPTQLVELEKGKTVDAGFDKKIKITKEFIQELKDNDILKREFFDYADDILILHGDEDELIDFSLDEQFCDNNVIEFIPIIGADHRYQKPVQRLSQR